MSRFVQILSLVLLAMASGAHGASDKSLPGCRAAKEFLPIARLYSEIQGDVDSHTVYKEMRRVRKLTCSGEFSDGQTVTYPSGGTATLYAGRDGATWNWSNGQSITLYAYRHGATWNWPNGQLMTLYAYRLDATWYWPNGRVITNYAGRKGASYYDSDGKTAISSGPELKTSSGELDMTAFLDIVEDLSAGTYDPRNP